MFVTTCVFRRKYYVILTIVFIILTHVSSEVISGSETSASLYEKGVLAYLENNFKDCVKYFEQAIEKHRVYSKTLQNCRINCKENELKDQPLYPDDVENLYFFEKTIKNTLCILKCKNEHKDIFGLYNVNKESEELFENQRAFEYLHICYFQTQKYQEAASAAFTYLVYHPDDKPILASLKHYSTFPGVDTNDIINYDAKEYVYLYVHGSDSYDKKNWNGVVRNMEESLIAYLQAEEECRAQCEGPFNQGWYPDFIPSIANHFTYSLRCKRKCTDKLSNINGEKYDDLVPSHYHYLQYAYYKLGNLEAACQSVASYLLFYPDDEDMKSNLEYYKSLPEVQDNYFTPKEEAIFYTKRESYETKLLKFIFKNFNFEKSGFPGEKEDNTLKIEVVKDAEELNGTKRYLADNFLTPKQCKSLIYIGNSFGKLGDGYQNNTPHTPMEIFGGITLTRMATLVTIGLINKEYLKTLTDVTEKAKIHVENYFKLPNLYFSYTHLVCRSSLSGSTMENRTDFSHQVHADNCNLHSTGSCEKTYPSYTSRDYSGIVYLNDNFIGGEFIFVKDYHGKIIESSIKPKCGRMIAFSSGVENLHAVQAVKKGTRCAIAVWFTLNSTQAENRQFVYDTVKDVNWK